ncbi:MAG: response regulator transcription factor [Chloroflexi bacterium]|nr:response regulator transcription factor [Chloroflexota bacterium]
MRILCVEDEPAIAAAIRDALVREGHAVDHVTRGDEVLDWLAAYTYDLVILDLVLPGMEGMDVCRQIRARGLNTPVLMVTALDQVEDRVRGLDTGADDYLSKPFAMNELLARVRALLRRDSPARDPVLRVADLELEPATLTVRRDGNLIRLTAREFALLELLARHPGRIFSRDRIIDAIWDADFAAGSNIVEVYIRSVRRKVDRDRGDSLIETIRGAGYRLRADVVEA